MIIFTCAMPPQRPRAWIPSDKQKAKARTAAIRRAREARERAQDLRRRRQAVIDARERPLNATQIAMVIEIALAATRYNK